MVDNSARTSRESNARGRRRLGWGRSPRRTRAAALRARSRAGANSLRNDRRRMGCLLPQMGDRPPVALELITRLRVFARDFFQDPSRAGTIGHPVADGHKTSLSPGPRQEQRVLRASATFAAAIAGTTGTAQQKPR